MRAWTAGLLCAALALPAGAAPRRKLRRASPAPEAPDFIPLYPPRVSTQPITFVWPPEGAVIGTENEYVFGNVADPSALFTINGETVSVHKDGGFIAWLPIASGTFTFHAELALSSGTVDADRRIVVPPLPAPLPDGKLAIDPASLWPRADLELRPGDWWTLRMKATRDQHAQARVGGGPWVALREVNTSLGIYEASQQVAPGQEFGPALVEYRLGEGWSSVKAKSRGLVSASSRTPPIATVRPNPAGHANVKVGVGESFLLFPQPGTRFETAGREGGMVRLNVAPGLTGWVDAHDVDLSNTSAPPHAVVEDIVVSTSPAGAIVHLPLNDRVPFAVEENDALDGLTLRLYYAATHVNWVTHDVDDFVDTVRYKQEASNIVAVRVRLKPGRRLWGWSAHYNGKGLNLELRRAPRYDAKRPLAGLRVMLDPGHTHAPLDGAVGPLGTREVTATYAIAQAMAERLRAEGAVPVFTRESPTDDVPLIDRPRMAVERGADLFLSLHLNAIPDGTNPFAKPHGFMVFYYHPHSLALARAIHASYVKRIPLADEGLIWGDLLVARLSSMPAILIENAFLILPDQEALVNDPAFRDKLARAVVAGLKSFMAEAAERGRR